MGSDSKPAADSAPTRVRFHYIKSNLFRAVHVDGAIGGITPAGNIHCAIYSERGAIPQTSEHPISEDGTLLPADSVDGQVGLVREMDVDLILNRRVAEDLRNWLTQKIEEFDAATGQKSP